MSDETKPHLDLGPPPASLRREEARPRTAGLWVVAGLQLVIIALLVLPWTRPGRGPTAESAQEWRRTALQLEERRLDAEAAAAWERFQSLAPASDERAAIWYRIGDLHRRAEDYAAAARAFLQAEIVAGEGSSLEAEIGPALVDCLRRLGLQGEVGRELARRTGGDGQGGEVVATFAGESLTRGDLDRLIERSVDRRLAALGPGAGAQRQEWLDRLSTSEARRRFFDEWLQTELFSRRALELDLDEDPEFLAARETLVTQLLASRFLERELKAIEPSEVDLRAHHQANLERWSRPEQVTATVIALRSGESAEDVLASIEDPEDFRAEAKRREDVQERGPGWSEMQFDRGSVHPLLGRSAERLFELEVGQWTPSALADSGRKYLALVEAKRPAGPAPFEEVRDAVRADYWQRKMAERTERLQQDLMERYDVEIREQAFAEDGDD